jgi:hypothetical protein
MVRQRRREEDGSWEGSADGCRLGVGGVGERYKMATTRDVVREERRERRRGSRAAAAAVGRGEVMGIVWEEEAMEGG